MTDAREATNDEISCIAWWNALDQAGRARWASVAGTVIIADAWAAFKRAAEVGATYPDGPRVVAESHSAIDVDIGVSAWQQMGTDRYVLEEDYKVSGDIWRVHLNDADPLPSSPHAHCIGGTKRFIGCKLHLGTGQLFTSTNKPLGKRLATQQFDRLIALIRPKFPGISLPIPTH